MSELYDNFQDELEAWREKYRHQPRKELLQLLLLAMEREELVTVSYREELMEHRLEELDIPEPIKAIFRQCLVWAWRDEEMHATYTRGLLTQIGGWWTRLTTRIQQIAGWVAGWASSVQQHLRWGRAPLSRAVAAIVVTLGSLSGKVPKAMRDEMRYLSFRTFCSVQIDAERTAAAAWERMYEVAEEYPGVDERTRRQFYRMWRDEERHREVFELISRTVEETGGLAVETTADEIAEKVGELGPYFLPRERRTEQFRQHPVGSGGRVAVQEHEKADDRERVLTDVLEAADFENTLRERADELDKPVADLEVVIKPTFMLGYHGDDPSTVTDPELVALLAKRLKTYGISGITVGECPNLYNAFYEGRSVERVGEYFGYDDDAYRLVDLSESRVSHEYPQGMAERTISKVWCDADLRIVFSKMRSHPTDFAHLCLGGTQGVGAPLEDYLFPERLAHRVTALMMPISEHPPHFSLLDGYASAADGLVGIIGCSDPPSPGRLYAGRDALAVDRVATRHMGHDAPRDEELIDAACHWFGDPQSRTEVVGTDAPLDEWRHPYANEWTTLLSLLAGPIYEYSSGRGEVFLPPMDQEVFPRRNDPGAIMRMRQWGVRQILGLRRPS